jgi:hypothetical protein
MTAIHLPASCIWFSRSSSDTCNTSGGRASLGTSKSAVSRHERRNKVQKFTSTGVPLSWHSEFRIYALHWNWVIQKFGQYSLLTRITRWFGELTEIPAFICCASRDILSRIRPCSFYEYRYLFWATSEE